jgi:hypothetical protein
MLGPITDTNVVEILDCKYSTTLLQLGPRMLNFPSNEVSNPAAQGRLAWPSVAEDVAKDGAAEVDNLDRVISGETYVSAGPTKLEITVMGSLRCVESGLNRTTN